MLSKNASLTIHVFFKTRFISDIDNIYKYRAKPDGYCQNFTNRTIDPPIVQSKRPSTFLYPGKGHIERIIATHHLPHRSLIGSK